MKRDALQPLGNALDRFLPLILSGVILLIAFFVFIRPRLSDYQRGSIDAAALETRVNTMRGLIARSAGSATVPDTETLREFQTRVAADDKTPELIEQLAQLALESAPGRVKGLLIEAADRVRVDAPATPGSPRAVASGGESLDPRFELFEAPLQYTPVTVTFDSTYEAIGQFVWRLRDLPTLVEVHSMELTRGLPLMKAKVVVFALQRFAPATATAPGPSIRAEGPVGRGAVRVGG